MTTLPKSVRLGSANIKWVSAKQITVKNELEVGKQIIGHGGLRLMKNGQDVFVIDENGNMTAQDINMNDGINVGESFDVDPNGNVIARSLAVAETVSVANEKFSVDANGDAVVQGLVARNSLSVTPTGGSEVWGVDANGNVTALSTTVSDTLAVNPNGTNTFTVNSTGAVSAQSVDTKTGLTVTPDATTVFSVDDTGITTTRSLNAQEGISVTPVDTPVYSVDSNGNVTARQVTVSCCLSIHDGVEEKFSVNSDGIMNTNGIVVNGPVTIESSVYTSKSHGVIENKPYVQKIPGVNNYINITGGSGYIIRGTPLVRQVVTWASISNYPVNLAEGELRWVVCDYTNNISLYPLMPDTMDAFNEIVIIGRVWVAVGELIVSPLHLVAAFDPDVSRMSIWNTPAFNSKRKPVIARGVGSDLYLNAGELFRWPIVRENNTDVPRHSFAFSLGDGGRVTYLWQHLYNRSTYIVLNVSSPPLISSSTSIFDNGTVNGTTMTSNTWGTHRLGVYAGSNERVLFITQYSYATKDDAIASWNSESFKMAAWASDGLQIAMVAVIIFKANTTYGSATEVVYIPL